jgi:hypothetical protein
VTPLRLAEITLRREAIARLRTARAWASLPGVLEGGGRHNYALYSLLEAAQFAFSADAVRAARRMLERQARLDDSLYAAAVKGRR